MATTVGAFSAIDDSEVDADSPITETLITRLRDNSYYIDEGTNLTAETTTGQFLEPNGSGGVRWGTVNSNNVLDKTKGVGTFTNTAATIAKISDKILVINVFFASANAANITIDTSNDTYVAAGFTGSYGDTGSGTLSGSFATLLDFSGTTADIEMRLNGSNYEISHVSGGGAIAQFNYVYY